MQQVETRLKQLETSGTSLLLKAYAAREKKRKGPFLRWTILTRYVPFAEREFGQASAKTKFQLPVPEQREVEGARRNHGRDQQAARRIQEEINQLQLKLEKSIKRERARSNNLGPPGVNAWDRL